MGRLQLETWGEGFIDMVPPAILLVTQKIGGIVAGAFTPENELIAFVYGMPGRRKGMDIHWSHMLAVKKAWRGRGLGRELKEFQRRFVLDQGIARIHWTFDPLESLNATLNLVRLGALPEEYARDLYGDGESSTLYSTIGTDRFIVTWYLRNEDRERRQARYADVDDPLSAPAVLGSELRFTPAKAGIAAVRIEIPASIQDVKKQDPDLARAWRKATRAAFTHYYENKYAVVDFVKDESENQFFYVMARPK